MLTHLRQARALVSHDAEALHLGTLTLERIAHIAGANVGFTLGQCAPHVLSLLAESPGTDQNSGRELFETVRQARNMAIHGGAWVRHHTTRLVDLFLLLEQAISTKMKVIEQIMVRAPLEAKPWHVLGHARNDMLRNSFSALPIFIGPVGNQRWKLLRDEGIVRLISGEHRPRREEILSQPIAQAIANGLRSRKPKSARHATRRQRSRNGRRGLSSSLNAMREGQSGWWASSHPSTCYRGRTARSPQVKRRGQIESNPFRAIRGRMCCATYRSRARPHPAPRSREPLVST